MEVRTAVIPQHLKALRRANRVRLGLAAVKAEVAAGDLTVAEALEDPRAVSLQLDELLMCQRRWGRARARRAILAASSAGGLIVPLSENRRVGDLTPRQRERIAEVAPRTLQRATGVVRGLPAR